MHSNRLHLRIASESLRTLEIITPFYFWTQKTNNSASRIAWQYLQHSLKKMSCTTGVKNLGPDRKAIPWSLVIAVLEGLGAKCVKQSNRYMRWCRWRPCSMYPNCDCSEVLCTKVEWMWSVRRSVCWTCWGKWGHWYVQGAIWETDENWKYKIHECGISLWRRGPALCVVVETELDNEKSYPEATVQFVETCHHWENTKTKENCLVVVQYPETLESIAIELVLGSEKVPAAWHWNLRSWSVWE